MKTIPLTRGYVAGLAVALALSGCSLVTKPSQLPLPSVEHPVCVEMPLKLDGTTNALQTSAQDLFTIQVNGSGEVGKVAVCYKGKQ